ncbi:MAG: radical SAM protein [Candidatus Omnitrophica bacterium]|nr:radical SAM protein [Candidatus Omnitrophota bacterium]
MRNSYRYIYGPVPSWRLGSSLGVDLISREDKVCSFDCGYCQIGETKVFSDKRQVLVPTEDILKEIKTLPDVRIDYITFSGRGEPTLAANLGEVITGIRKIRKEKIAVITNSSLMSRHDVRKDLALADFVMAKMDAHCAESLLKVNKPVKSVTFATIVDGIKKFKSDYKGKLALQIMFTAKNKDYAGDIASVAKDIGPDEVQINTPLRPSAEKPLSRQDIDAIKPYFKDMKVISVYDIEKTKTDIINKEATLKRRGSHD